MGKDDKIEHMSQPGGPKGEQFLREAKDSSRERFERRQRHVAVMIRLDQLMNSSYGEVKEEKLWECIEPLPDVLKQGAAEVIKRHLERKQGTLWTEKEIRRMADEHGYPTGPEGLGSFLFFHRTREEPVGEVRLERAGESLIMTLADPADYRHFYEPRLVLGGKKDSKKRKRIDDTSGSYHTELIRAPFPMETYRRLTFGGELNFVLLVKASLQDPEHRKIVVHERQHHINHAMLDLFERSERYPKKPDAIDPAMTRPVKDELLAYLREEATGVFLAENIFSPLYERLFHTDPPEAGEKMREVIREAARIIDTSADVWGESYARDALVFHLIDIPLEDIPAHMEQLTEFFRPLVQAVQPFPHTSALLNSFEIFRTTADRQGAYDAMQRKTFDMADATHDMVQAVFTQPAEVRESQKAAFDAQHAGFLEDWKEFQEGERGMVFGYVEPKNAVSGRDALERVLLDLSSLPRIVLQRFSQDMTDEEASKCVVARIEKSFTDLGFEISPIRQKPNKSINRELSVYVKGDGDVFWTTLLLEPKVEMYER